MDNDDETVFILKIDPLNGLVVKLYNSYNIAAEENFISKSSVVLSCKRHTTNKGYYYRHFDDMVVSDVYGNKYMKGSSYIPLQLLFIGGGSWCLDTEVNVMNVIDLVKINPFTNLPEIEIWKPIINHESSGYYISNFGRIKRKKYNYWKLMTLSKFQGYERIELQGCRYKVHRLVATHFIDGQTYENNIINHKNEIKDDNNYWNLEWCSYKYNLTYGSLSLDNKKTTKAVNQLDILTGEVIASFRAVNEAAIVLGIDKGSISNNCKGGRSSAGGYKFEYK